MISQYNIASPEEAYGVKNLRMVFQKRLKMQGFIVSDPDMGPAYAAEHQKNVQKWSKCLSDRVYGSIIILELAAPVS